MDSTQDKPEILHVIDSTEVGGAEMCLYNLLQSLGNSYRFTVVVLGKAGPLSDKITSLGISVCYPGKNRSRWNPFSLLSVLQFIRIGRYDVVHTHLHKSYIAGGLACLGRRCKYIIHDQSDPSFATLQDVVPNRLLAGAYLVLFRFVVKRSSHVIVLTEKRAHYYHTRLGIPECSTTVLPNPVDLAEFIKKENDGQAITTCTHLPETVKKIAMVARLVTQKDWDTFINVAEIISTKAANFCVFYVVGSGPEEKRLKDMVEVKQLDNVVFLGYREDVPALLAQTDVFLLTSRFEPFGNVVIEAMAAGCPVVATRTAGPESHIRHGVNGYLAEIGDACSLANHVEKLLDGSYPVKTIIENAMKSVVHNYTLPVYAQRLSTIYRELIDR